MSEDIYFGPISAVAKKIRQFVPADIKRICENNVSACFLSERKGGALYKPTNSNRFLISVGLNYSPMERLITFLHELFHITYIENGVDANPLQSNCDRYRYLEATLDDLACEFMIKNMQWSVSFFEEKFVFRHTDFAIL